MRVGFDAHMVGQRETGNETYALGLLHGFQQIGFTVDTYALVPLNLAAHRNHRVWPGPSLLRVPFASPILTLRDELSLFHGTYVLPPVLPCAGVVTVHDITFELHPEWFPERVRRMLGLLVPVTLRRAAHVITISECTKRDIANRYGLPDSKITVTHLAPRTTFSGPTARGAPLEPFFLFVGNVEPRKNVRTVLRALRILHDRGIPARLTVAGKFGYHDDLIRRLVYDLRLRGWVRFTGYVTDQELRELYATATALVHPALYEGFGLTPLEAMAQGVPVIASNTSSIPEVVDDAALLLSPDEPERWADTMQRVMESPSLRDDLQRRGLERAKRFSWRRCAEETVAIYQAVVDRDIPVARGEHAS